jgi:hypothetical protein
MRVERGADLNEKETEQFITSRRHRRTQEAAAPIPENV